MNENNAAAVAVKPLNILIVDDSATMRALLHRVVGLSDLPIGTIYQAPNGLEAIKILHDTGTLFSPGKASNAGGVATSGLEMSQNSMRLPWPKEEVDQRLHQIMTNIHRTCLETAEKYGAKGNYVIGANIAGFLKVADAMLDQGLV